MLTWPSEQHASYASEVAMPSGVALRLERGSGIWVVLQEFNLL